MKTGIGVAPLWVPISLPAPTVELCALDESPRRPGTQSPRLRSVHENTYTSPRLRRREPEPDRRSFPSLPPRARRPVAPGRPRAFRGGEGREGKGRGGSAARSARPVHRRPAPSSLPDHGACGRGLGAGPVARLQLADGRLLRAGSLRAGQRPGPGGGKGAPGPQFRLQVPCGVDQPAGGVAGAGHLRGGRDLG